MSQKNLILTDLQLTFITLHNFQAAFFINSPTHLHTNTHPDTHTDILKDEKVKPWESKQTVNRYFHFKPVY